MLYRTRKIKANDGEWYVAEYRRGRCSEWKEYTGIVSRSPDAVVSWIVENKLGGNYALAQTAFVSIDS